MILDREEGLEGITEIQKIARKYKANLIWKNSDPIFSMTKNDGYYLNHPSQMIMSPTQVTLNLKSLTSQVLISNDSEHANSNSNQTLTDVSQC